MGILNVFMDLPTARPGNPKKVKKKRPLETALAADAAVKSSSRQGVGDGKRGTEVFGVCLRSLCFFVSLCLCFFFSCFLIFFWRH